MSKRREFIPMAHMEGGYGSLAIGTDGSVLYKAYDAITGEEATVVLFTDIGTLESFAKAMNDLTEQHSEYNELHQVQQTITDLTPAKVDFSTMMSELKKPGKLH